MQCKRVSLYNKQTQNCALIDIGPPIINLQWLAKISNNFQTPYFTYENAYTKTTRLIVSSFGSLGETLHNFDTNMTSKHKTMII